MSAAGSGNGIAAWLEALGGAVQELAQVTLGFDDASISIRDDGMSRDISGSYIALVGDASALQLGIISDAAGCEGLARALLAMEEDEELSQADVVDAVGEVVNILAGIVKRQMADHDPDLKLGLPIFLNGCIELMEQQEIALADVTMGSLAAQIVVIKDGRQRKRDAGRPGRAA